MPFTGNPGDGTVSNPFEVSTVSQYEAIGAQAPGSYFTFVADIDYGTGAHPRLDWSNGANVDWNGYKVTNYGSAASVQLLRNITGLLENVWFDGSANIGDNRASIMLLNSGGEVRGMRVDGTISGGAGDASVFDALNGDSFNDSVSDVLVNADITSTGGVASVVRSAQAVTIDKVVLTGTLSGSTLSFVNSSSPSVINSFWDSTKNGTLTGTNGGTGKTTTELQTLDTYTNTATTGLTTAYDMVRVSSYTGAQTWTIADSDGVEYPKLGFQSEPALIPSVTFTDEVSQPIQGALVRFFTVDAFDSKSPAFTNFTLVGSAYTTDANGVATYDPNTDPAVDGTKVYGAIAFDAEAGSTEMEVSTGISFGRQNVDVTLP